MNKGGFSWKRATGVTRAKSRISRKTGIPLTKSGRQRKVGRAVTGGGCLLPVLILALAACGAATPTPIVVYVTAGPEAAAPTTSPTIASAPSATPAPTATPIPTPTPMKPYRTVAQLERSIKATWNADKGNKANGFKVLDVFCIQETRPTPTSPTTRYSCNVHWNKGPRYKTYTIVADASGGWIPR